MNVIQFRVGNHFFGVWRGLGRFAGPNSVHLDQPAHGTHNIHHSCIAACHFRCLRTRTWYLPPLNPSMTAAHRAAEPAMTARVSRSSRKEHRREPAIMTHSENFGARLGGLYNISAYLWRERIRTFPSAPYLGCVKTSTSAGSPLST